MTKQHQDSSYDARFSSALGGSEYDDLLIALDFYDEFQAQVGIALKRYLEDHCVGQDEIHVLEAGPGTGITTMQLLKADPRVKITAVDNEKKMLDAVRDRFASMEGAAGRVDFVLSDILEFLESKEDNCFDVFASVYTLHNFTPDFRIKVLDLIAKKLKHGGVFINGDKYAREGNEHQSDFDSEIRNYDKFEMAAAEAESRGNIERAAHLRKIREEWTLHAAEDEKNKITVEEQNQILKEFGFKDVEWGKRFDLVVTVKAIKV